MGYVAVKGGADAIRHSLELVEFYRIKDALTPIDIQQIKSQLRLAVDKVMGEGGLYAPDYAAIALKQAEGEVLEQPCKENSIQKP
jgi:alpha-D-ribose 1-methylphosphonate 5-triphosphate synthase subunit PhnI